MISDRDTGLAERLIQSLEVHPAIDGVGLAGSRARGDANPLSDWDFEVKTADFPSVAGALPALVAPVEPLAQQWDRLSDHACYMLMLRGAVKVDLIFDEPHEPEPPWDVSRETLKGIDDHFWDWMLWLRGKEGAGKGDFVATHLDKVFDHLLAPLGAEQPPASIPEAVDSYVETRSRAERRFGHRVPRDLEAEVAPLLVD